MASTSTIDQRKGERDGATLLSLEVLPNDEAEADRQAEGKESDVMNELVTTFTGEVMSFPTNSRLIISFLRFFFLFDLRPAPACLSLVPLVAFTLHRHLSASVDLFPPSTLSSFHQLAHHHGSTLPSLSLLRFHSTPLSISTFFPL